ncbi:hypothetical protein [Streptomyces sp. PvR034]|uniref:hypothetical protein n=1 Tax=Streptomyces sp. PvR034 TaxID=3156401 RepID=UPI0033943488
MNKRITLTWRLLVGCALLTGCSTTSYNSAEERNEKEMKAATETASGRVLAMMDLKGAVTHGSSHLLECEGYEPAGKVNRAYHPWSVYDVPVEDMETTMARMRTALPQNNWKITEDGPDTSPSKTPTLVADSTDGRFSVKLRLMGHRADGRTSVLAVTVVSSCFRSAPAA